VLVVFQQSFAFVDRWFFLSRVEASIVTPPRRMSLVARRSVDCRMSTVCQNRVGINYLPSWGIQHLVKKEICPLGLLLEDFHDNDSFLENSGERLG